MRESASSPRNLKGINNRQWRIFGFREKRKSAEDAYNHAAKLLYVAAKTETASKGFSDLDHEVVLGINTLLFYTRATIFIGWLRRLDASTSDQKWLRLLRAFERLLFPEDPSTGLELLSYIKKIDDLIARAQSFTGAIQPSVEEFPLEMHRWWDDWLGLAFGPRVIDSIGYNRSLGLTLQVIDETQFLGTILADIAKELGR